MRRNLDLAPDEYLENIKLKVSLGEASTKIGAIVGNGTAQQVENLAQYGKTFGVLTTIREEFINMFEPDEIRNRFKHETLPFPILCAFQDADLKRKIIGLLETDVITDSNLDEMIEQVYEVPQVREIGKYLRLSVKEATENMQYKNEFQTSLVKLLEYTLLDLPSQ